MDDATLKIRGFHMHVYFDASQLEQARELCEQASSHFDVSMGRMHSRPVGPHPTGSCQLDVPNQKFEDVLRFLMKHRNGLTVFVHGLSGNDFIDHTDLVMWLGESQPLDSSIFSESAGPNE